MRIHMAKIIGMIDILNENDIIVLIKLVLLKFNELFFFSNFVACKIVTLCWFGIFWEHKCAIYEIYEFTQLRCYLPWPVTELNRWVCPSWWCTHQNMFHIWISMLREVFVSNYISFKLIFVSFTKFKDALTCLKRDSIYSCPCFHPQILLRPSIKYARIELRMVLISPRPWNAKRTREGLVKYRISHLLDELNISFPLPIHFVPPATPQRKKRGTGLVFNIGRKWCARARTGAWRNASPASLSFCFKRQESVPPTNSLTCRETPTSRLHMLKKFPPLSLSLLPFSFPKYYYYAPTQLIE